MAEDQSSFTLANGYVTAKVNKTSGDLTSLKYKGLELIGYGSGHPAGYWEQDPSAAKRYAVTVTIDGQWKLKEVLPPSRGQELVDAENVDQDSSAAQLQWYYQHKRAN